MKKKYPISQEKKVPPDTKTNHLTFTPSARQRVAFFAAAGSATGEISCFFIDPALVYFYFIF